MKKVELSKQDFTNIKDLALKYWVENSSADNNILCISYSKALIAYCNSKGYVIKEGQIYAQQT